MARQAIDGNVAHALCMLGIEGYKHTLRICNMYCFSTATMGTRTRFIVTMYIQCFCCYNWDRVCLLRGATTVFKYNWVSIKERVMAEAGNGRHVPAEIWAYSQASPCETCGSESDTGTAFSPYASVFPTHLHHISILLQLWDGQADETWEPSNKTVLFRISGSAEQKITLFTYWNTCMFILLGKDQDIRLGL